MKTFNERREEWNHLREYNRRRAWVRAVIRTMYDWRDQRTKDLRQRHRERWIAARRLAFGEWVGRAAATNFPGTSSIEGEGDGL